jgi:hypothetical protein
VADGQAAAIAARLRAEIARATSGLTLEITANLIEATPVDTGLARASWVPAIGETASATGAAAQAAGVAAVTSYKLGDGPLSITNNVPYIERLIAGSSSQAPIGWDLAAIDTAVATVQAQYDAVQIDVSSGSGEVSVAITPRVPGGAP